MAQSRCPTPEPQLSGAPGPRPGTGGEERRSERQVGGGGGVGEGPRGLAKRGGGAAPGRPQRIRPGAPPHATQQLVSSPVPQVPHYRRQEEPLGKLGPSPSPLLRAQAVLTPAARDPPLPSRGPGPASYPGGLGRWCPKCGGASVDDLGADSAHSSPRGQVGSGSDSGVAKLLWASVSSTRKWESQGYLAELE